MKIYLAGGFFQKDEIKQLAEYLEKHGIIITDKWYEKEQTLPSIRSIDENIEIGTNEINGIMNSDKIVAIITDRKYPYKGTLIEIGIKLGQTYPTPKVILLTGTNFNNTNCHVLEVPHLSLCNKIELFDNLEPLSKYYDDILHIILN